MRWLTLLLVVTSVVAGKIDEKHACDYKDCRAGRECLVVDGEAQCLCVVSCPDHFKPVCGSDGVSYDNHCKLHQKACISEHHISIEHKGHCKKSYDKRWKEAKKKKNSLSKEDLEQELRNDLIKILKKNERKQVDDTKGRPAVCYAPQRNALRFLLVEHWEDDVKKQKWHVEGMTYRESLWGWFYTCDKDQDNYLIPEELLACTKEVAFFARPGQDTEQTKALCIDALVEDGDKNHDWRLDFEEFTHIMDPKYHPKEKKCSLEGKNYVDGAEVHIDCNHCVCAVGNWVCASTDCKKSYSDKKKDHPKASSHGRDNELDNGIAVTNDITSDVHVVDTWLEENRKDKQKAKKNKENESEDDDLLLDFDDDTAKDDEEEKAEDTELDMDDYYDDLLEQTKLKNPKKRKLQLEKALKEVKMLRKKTAHLQKLLGGEKDMKETVQAVPSSFEVKSKASRKDKYEKDKLDKKLHHQSKPEPKTKKYYDEIFEKTNWNDLIDWGDMKKVLKNPKKFSHKNYV